MSEITEIRDAIAEWAEGATQGNRDALRVQLEELMAGWKPSVVDRIKNVSTDRGPRRSRTPREYQEAEMGFLLTAIRRSKKPVTSTDLKALFVAEFPQYGELGRNPLNVVATRLRQLYRDGKIDVNPRPTCDLNNWKPRKHDAITDRVASVKPKSIDVRRPGLWGESGLNA
jgi:hypothetical protein